MLDQFVKDVHEGLTRENKTIPSKYFYNQKGDKLFEAIMNMPEYYPTSVEQEILEFQSRDIVKAFQQRLNKHFELI